jgi:hypothetical protein
VPSEGEVRRTATFEDCFRDGHVPLAAVRKLLFEKPDIGRSAVPKAWPRRMRQSTLICFDRGLPRV